jgi:type VI secretion system protein ImpA
MELESLLAPISDGEPGGTDMSLSNEVDQIQELRREDDPTLDQGEWVTSLKVADWPGVVKACEDLLKHHSKDLRVAGWYTEASARVRGFTGLADGLSLCALLMDRFWDHLHPLPDGDDQEERIGNLRWMTSKVEELTKQIVLIAKPGQSGKGYSLMDVEAARARRLSGETEPSTLPSGEPAPTVENIWRVLANTGLRAYEAQRSEIERARSSWEHLEKAVDARLGSDGPSFGSTRKALEDALDGFVRLGRESSLTDGNSGADAMPMASGGDDVSTSLQNAPGQVAVAGGPQFVTRIQSRAQALEQLRLVAEFFRTTEPHSPVAYLADKAAQWGTMPLHDWLRAVVKDTSSLAHIDELLGIERRDENM